MLRRRSRRTRSRRWWRRSQLPPPTSSELGRVLCQAPAPSSSELGRAPKTSGPPLARAAWTRGPALLLIVQIPRRSALARPALWLPGIARGCPGTTLRDPPGLAGRRSSSIVQISADPPSLRPSGLEVLFARARHRARAFHLRCIGAPCPSCIGGAVQSRASCMIESMFLAHLHGNLVFGLSLLRTSKGPTRALGRRRVPRPCELRRAVLLSHGGPSHVTLMHVICAQQFPGADSAHTTDRPAIIACPFCHDSAGTCKTGIASPRILQSASGSVALAGQVARTWNPSRQCSPMRVLRSFRWLQGGVRRLRSFFSALRSVR